jgi:hypothetical protein
MQQNLHIFCNTYFLEPTVREADVTSTSAVRYDGTKLNSTKKMGPGTALSGVTKFGDNS